MLVSQAKQELLVTVKNWKRFEKHYQWSKLAGLFGNVCEGSMTQEHTTACITPSPTLSYHTGFELFSTTILKTIGGQGGGQS